MITTKTNDEIYEAMYSGVIKVVSQGKELKWDFLKVGFLGDRRYTYVPVKKLLSLR